MNAASSSSFDEKFRQNQSGGGNFLNEGQLFDSASDVASKGMSLLSSGIGKSWGFASSLASSATQKVQSGEVSSLASSGFGFLSNVAKTSLNTASNVVNTGLQNMPNSSSIGSFGGSQAEPENSDFWNGFGQKKEASGSIWGENKISTQKDGSFGGFGGGNNEEEKNGDGISDLYGKVMKLVRYQETVNTIHVILWKSLHIPLPFPC